MSRDRLLIVARELTRGGAAYLALRYAQQLQARFLVDVLLTGPCDEDFLGEFPAGINIYRMGGSRSRPVDAPLRFLHEFRQEHYDLLPFRISYHTMLATSIFPDWPACAAASVVQAERRMIFLVDEGLHRYPGLGPAERAVLDRAILAADRILPVSRRLWERMAERCPPLRERPWTSLRPPVEVERVLERASSPQTAMTTGDIPVVLTVARLTPDKQISLCLQVHHRLKEAGLRFRWYVIGRGPEEQALRLEIGRLGMVDDFILIDYLENIYSCMSRCDIFALFSSSEGCPTVVIEAILLGCAVAMSDVNGADELIEHGRTGLVLANDAESIAKGLARIVQDDRLRAGFREAVASSAIASSIGGEAATLLNLIDSCKPADGAPRVSILIPTYNQERFIDKAIGSALAQDVHSLEVIVVDDASTDSTGETARSWDFDRRFRYVRNDRNLGRVANYRRALTELARGDWVLMLDGDDFLADSDFIRLALDALGRHSDLPVVFAQAGHRVHYLDSRRGDVDILPAIDGTERQMPGGEYLRFVFETTFFTHLGALYNRKLAIENDFYSAEISSSDMESLLRLALSGDVLILNTIAGYWVQHGHNASSNLRLDDLAPNVKIFRQVARRAVRNRLATWQQLDGPLTNYEAMTLTHLFGAMIGKAVHGPFDLLRLVGIGVSINPGLLRNRRFVSGCLGFVRPLTTMAFHRSRIGKIWVALLRRIRASTARSE